MVSWWYLFTVQGFLNHFVVVGLECWPWRLNLLLYCVKVLIASTRLCGLISWF
jgi:hypothetical protein